MTKGKAVGRGPVLIAADPPEDPDVTLTITIRPADARWLMPLAAAAGLTPEACVASIIAEVRADDVNCHEGMLDAQWDQAKWDLAAKAAPRSASSGAFDEHGGEGQLQ